LTIVDVSYGGENGLNQAIELSAECLQNVKFIQEKKLLSKLMEQIAQDTGKYSVGLKETLFALDASAAEVLILWENLDYTRYVLRHPSTGVERTLHLTTEQSKQRSYFVDGGVELEVVTCEPLLEWFADNYKKFGAALEFVTDKSQLGNQFVKGFGGIGALLRYSLECQMLAGLDDDAVEEDDDFL